MGVIESNYSLGINTLSLLVSNYEKKKGVNALNVKEFIVNFLNSDNHLNDVIFFQYITSYGGRYNMSAADVLELAGLKGAYDILTSGCLSGLVEIH